MKKGDEIFPLYSVQTKITERILNFIVMDGDKGFRLLISHLDPLYRHCYPEIFLREGSARTAGQSVNIHIREHNKYQGYAWV